MIYYNQYRKNKREWKVQKWWDKGGRNGVEVKWVDNGGKGGDKK